ncbi:hypothetical protein QM012_002877 [Aureobasidium pullulans]|uniref:Uncharacterized protein n=1 Tax=Aureobasidium pullulans TaxID=5580 RepID=A0ABR0TAT0_AURPU
MSSAEDRIEDPFILSSNMSFHEHTAQKRKISHSDCIDDGTPLIHVDPDPNNTLSDTEDIKVAYNGPATIHVVMLRVSNESSVRPMPQAAFFDRNKALAFSTRILLQWCEAHYDDYLWKGAESLRGGLVERYAAYDAQTGQQLAVADVIRVSVFDVNKTKVVLKREEKYEKDDEGANENDEAGNAKSHEQLEEGFENPQDTETTSSQPDQTMDQEVDLEMLLANLAPPHQAAPGEYAMESVTALAKYDNRIALSGSRHQGAWREDHEMRVFGGPTE